jgi:hypothetical protein
MGTQPISERGQRIVETIILVVRSTANLEI